MIDNRLIGPIILQDSMTKQSYLDILQNTLPQLEDVPVTTRISMYFQYYGAPYYTRLVMQLLSDIP